ncbi:hypothetical protein Cgig2_018037 [Carnegiea gigantea]|uniref:Uncharacterized protein n=1 Tax=Carnegiea gigantea TaxID=171969 RepID=A0A9Q1JZ41_9CARY|nr:hypothetical protein Cgig2_018037 [Carnegiea gigantea]
MGILVMITIMCSTLVGITIEGRGSTIQRHSLLSPTLGLSLVTLLHVFDIRLKVAFHAKGAPEKTQHFHRAPAGNPGPRPWSGFPPIGVADLSFRPPKPLSLSSSSPSGACRQFAPARWHPSSQGSAGANDHDLANFSTNVRLAKASAMKCPQPWPVCSLRVFSRHAPDRWSPWDPPAVGNPCASLETSSSTSLPVDKGAPVLKGVRADAAIASYTPSARGRLWEPK